MLPCEEAGARGTPGRDRLTDRAVLELVLRVELVELGPGDYLRWDGLIPHDAGAIGDEPASMLVIRLTRDGEPHD